MISAGQNLRFINDNLRGYINTHIDSLGWNDADRFNKPVVIMEEQLEPEQMILQSKKPLEPNAVSLSMEDMSFEDMEMGSDLVDQRIFFVVDIYAESVPVGTQLAGDLTAFAQSLAVFPVNDLSVSPSPLLFNCEIESVVAERNRLYEQKYGKYWWVITFLVSRAQFASSL